MIKSINVREELISRGWMLEKKGKNLYSFLAPDPIRVDKTSVLFVPRSDFEGRPNYDRIVNQTIYTIADIYEEDPNELRARLQA